MRYILVVIGFFIYSSVFAYPQIRNCAQGENINGNICDACFDDRFYEGDNFDYWDKFYPQGINTIFSSNSRTIFDLNPSYIVHNGVNDDRITSTYMPGTVNNAIIFANYDFRVVGHPVSRNNVAGRLLYNIRYAKEQSSGYKINTNWNYTDYDENINPNGTVNISYNVVNLGTSDKYINTSNIQEHNQCFTLRVDFCGDNVTSFGETCDDGNNVNGDGCSAVCQLEPVLPICGNSIIEAPETCDDGNTVNGDGCSAVCQLETPPPSSSSSSGGSSSSSSSSSSSGGGASSSSGGGSTYCGDGNVQRPNSNLQMEECDFGSESDWSFCSSNCTYSNLTSPIQGRGEITIPNGGKIVFGPIDNVVIGTGMNPYIAYSLGRPYVRNASDYDLYFDQICVVKQSGTTLIGNSVCEDTGRILRSGETISFPYTPNFVGAEITSGDFGDNTLVTTIKHKGIRYDDAYFASILDVRVAQSSVATTGGGTSYVSNTSNISDISEVADNGNLNPDENKNFVGVGVSTGSISSYTNDIDDADSVATIDSESDIYSDSLDQVSDVSGTAMGSTSLLSEFENYNGINNVFILKSKNFVVNTNILSGISGARTYIIENGDLEINTNISYLDNIAFVVKGGNVKINKSVASIDGTYITIAKDGVGGKFLGTGGKTTDILIINGSLYGNINNLISSRTYVKQNSTNQIDVGTVVSFGSSLFRKTAPLVSTFINEYLSSEKIAQ